MITLFISGRRWGLPDASPFVCKAEVLLKMSGLPFTTAPADFKKAPKGKIPYIEDDGLMLGDTTFIRWHLERKYGVDFDRNLTAEQKAVAWAFEKMCEDHLYWAIVNARWKDDANFNKGPREFFNAAPAPLRPIVARMVRKQVRRNLHGQGFGRHTNAEIAQLAQRDFEAISQFLGDKAWLMGEEPCGADASIVAMICSALCDRFETPIRQAAAAHANLVAYCDRGMTRWFKELAAA